MGGDMRGSEEAGVMCTICEQAKRDYGVGSPVSIVVRDLYHPLTPAERAERDRAISDLCEFLDACEEAERNRE
jgi:hypothetical protein